MTDITPQTLDAIPPLLTPDDPPPFRVVNADGNGPVLLVCDHASSQVPQRLGDLGLPDEQFHKHIALDIGSAELTTHLARRLGGPAVLAGYSRLVIDLNRQPGARSSVPESSDGIPIPGNQGLSDEDVDRRVRDLFWPYHHAITHIMTHRQRHGPPPVLISIHSFTPVMQGRTRPWHIGVLWNHDPRMAVPLIQRLRQKADLCVGDNEPYDGRHTGFTVDNHAGAAGLPHVVLEIRQDLLETTEGCRHWAQCLGEALEPLLADPGLYRVRHY